MNVVAWCGGCGESFRLAELVDVGAGRCPRCGEPFAPGYTSVLGPTARQILAAGDALEGALRQLRDIAPRLHVDRRRLVADLDVTNPDHTPDAAGSP